MNAQTMYADWGYCIVRQALGRETIESLKQLLSPIRKNKRKIPLLDQHAIATAVDQAVRPIFQGIQVETDELVELYLLVAHAPHPVKLGWHKDAQVRDGVHSFQLPLLPHDNIHQVVPGTHLRAINEEEIAARNAGGHAMPQAVRIELAVGDILLRSPFLFHRGYSLQGIDRLTYVGTYSERAG